MTTATTAPNRRRPADRHVPAAWVTTLLALAAIALLAPASAAAATLSITVGNDPTESIATQLGVTGSADSTTNFLALKLKPTGGAGCGANPAADTGEGVINDTTFAVGSYAFSRNWTFESAGTYLLCAWLRDGVPAGDPVVAAVERTITVRIPNLSLTVNAPATAVSGAVFQASQTGIAEAQRTAFFGAVPDTARGCAANWSALRSLAGYQYIDDTSITGGPTTVTKNVTITGSGVYLLCGYFQKNSLDTTPEATAVRMITIIAPCVVPSLTRPTLAAMKSALTAAHCPLGRVTYRASVAVKRGSVISVSPRAGTTLVPGAGVNVVVSSGAPCIVPKAVGKTLRSAKAALVNAHCTVGRVSYRHSRRYSRGRVSSLSRPRGTHLSPRAVIRIVVSSGRG